MQVEGKQLLDVCGYSYIEATIDGRQKSQAKRVIERQIVKHNLIDNIDYTSHTDVGRSMALIFKGI